MKTQLFILSVMIAVFVYSCGPSLQDTGIPADATVIGKYETGRGSKLRYYLTVNFFTQPDKENPEPEPPKDTTPKTADEIIEGLTLDFNMGEYQTADIPVSGEDYGNYKEGDEVKIKYEKGNPSNAVIDHP